MKEWQTSQGYLVRWHDKAVSTNDLARTWAASGAKHGSTVCADEQTAGRGRRGSSWFSGSGEGLTFSLIIRPTMARALWPRLALVSGLAVVKVMEQQGLAAELKWPNDVLVKNKKISGILLESVDDAVVVGVGINVNEETFAQPIADTATSMKMETGRSFVLRDLLENFIQELCHHAGLVERDFPLLVDAMRQRCALSGQTVKIISAGKTLTGVARGISDLGELQVASGGRIFSFLQADQVRVV